MNAKTSNGSLVDNVLATYATGLVYMTATGIGLLAAFIFLLGLLNEVVPSLSIILSALSLSCLILVWFVGGHGETHSRRGKLRITALWCLYALICGQLVLPIFMKLASHETGNGLRLVGLLLGTLSVSMTVIYFMARRHSSAVTVVNVLVTNKSTSSPTSPKPDFPKRRKDPPQPAL